MPLRINTNHHSQPEGGWSYPAPDGPSFSSDKVGAPGLKELLSKIRDYRISNGIPEGDPAHDVAMKYAVTCPWLIFEEEGEAKVSSEQERWVLQMWKSYPQPLAEVRVRDDRFEQCLKCQHFMALGSLVLGDEATRRLMLLNPAKHRKEHGWCNLHKWIPSVVVQFHKPFQFSKKASVTPECWLHSDPK
jgi:hypothetical protein